MSVPSEPSSKLSPQEKRAVLAQLLRQKERAVRTAPLSFAQQRLWFLDQLMPGNPVYTISRAFVLKGLLKQAVLEQSLQAIVQRHEIFRTTFTMIDGEPHQIIVPARKLSFAYEDIQSVPESEREEEIERQVSAMARQPFDLQRGPLLRAKLLRLAEEAHLLLLSVHHIIADGWSMTIFLQELATFYQAFSLGTAVELPGMPLQYADFALWQREWLQGEVLEEQLAYWKQQLRGAPAVLALPPDRPRPLAQTFQGGLHFFHVPRTLTESLRELSHRYNVTLFMTLLAAFQVLLARYSGQEDVVVGTPIAGRPRKELENLIGLFSNTLVLRTNLASNPHFSELLGRVRETALDAYAHQDAPFERLVEELAPERSLRHTPLVQVMFALQNTPEEVLMLEDLTLEALDPPDNGTARLDLTLEMIETQNGLRGFFEYNTDLFEAESVRRVADHLQQLLASIIAHPEERISALPLLREDERQQILFGWNAPQVEYVVDTCLHQLFEQQVEHIPDAIALVYEEQHLTYADLNARANRLAYRLRQLGVGPEILAGLYLQRSLEMIIGLLGILKAGGAYVPLDPDYPIERIAYMVQDARIQALLTTSALSQKIGQQNRQPVCMICLESEDEQKLLFRQPASNIAVGSQPENLAYVIYTSGSTSRPKGVQVTHANVAQLFAATNSDFHFDQRDVWTMFHSSAFDFSVWELWGTLLHGGRLVLVPYLLSRSPEEFYQLLFREHVTVLNQTPSAFSQLIWAEETSGATRMLALRLVIFGGEALDFQKLQPWFERHGDQLPALVNMYGITETTVHVTRYRLSRADLERPAKSMIGRPIPGLQVYLLDQELQPVPLGVTGELFIGGAGLTRGYLHRPELTAERFLPDPFNNQPGARLYKAGDLARYHSDGSLDFIGRNDGQVKIRGFRIEVGEIEAMLRQHDSIREAAVIASEDMSAEKRLIAYVVPEPEYPFSLIQLDQYLRARLPHYMIPARVMRLGQLPRSPNGKIDRRALPVLDASDRIDEATYVAPRTPLEELMAQVWSQVLGIERVGVFDNFFVLGGHSLLATQVIARIRNTLNVELPLRSLFEIPTVAGLTQHIQTTQSSAQRISFPPIQPVPRTDPLPLSFAQQRLWFLHQWEPDSPLYNIPVFWRVLGRLHLQALEQSFRAMLMRHEILRTTFLNGEEQVRPMIVPETGMGLLVEDLRHLPLAKREALALQRVSEEEQRPFDLARGPLLRASLLRLGDEEHILLLTMHHIISDGWSMTLFLRELASFYAAFSLGKAISLPPLSLQYGDFAAWQQQWMQGQFLDTQLTYWKEQLNGIPALLDLPTDRPRSRAQGARGAWYEFEVPPQLTADLKTLSRREGTTLFMTLLAAFQILLARYTSQKDIVVGSPVAGRTRKELEDMLGCFVNTLVLRTQMAGNATITDLLKQVRETTLQAYAHQEVPFEQIVEALQPERNLHHTPLFQVMFSLNNTPAEPFALAGLALTPLNIGSTTAKFDLSLGLVEENGGLSATFEYKSDLFDATTIARMATHFQAILEYMTTHPRQSLAEIPLLTDTERNQLLLDWNATQYSSPANALLQTLFDAQVSETPAKKAVVAAQGYLTYRELNRRANQLAYHLQELGVGPEVCVGICMERSLEMVVGLLGILKAGGAYLPIDPASPSERQAFFLQDAGTPLLLTQPWLRPRFTGYKGKIVCLDSTWETIATRETANPIYQARPDNLAYVLYTSGSTGTPKGVMISHRALCDRLVWEQAAFSFHSEDRVLHLTSLSFDVSVWEIFCSLLSGAQVVLGQPAEYLDSATLVRFIAEQKITIFSLVPSLLQALLDEPGLRHCTSLRLVIAGGEALSKEIQERFFTCLNAELYNGYGPTEATIDTTIHHCRSEPGQYLIPIGRPIGNMQVYVLDADLQPVPIGVVGELHVAGVGLARGYLSRPDLTAEKFIANPFVGTSHGQAGSHDQPGSYGASEAGTRLYKTGDLVRYRTNGDLEFLGRLDQQVKIRGYRVELGEIEACLKQHLAVRDAVVILEDLPVDKRLVAYIVWQPDQKAPIVELRAYLKQRLPDYMVPMVFVTLPALPLTASGKVDRHSLPTPDQSQQPGEESYIAPRTPVEEAVAAIWSEVLGRERVGISDNFFKVGGHSLLAARIISRVRATFQIDIPLRSLFEGPTVAEMAEVIVQKELEEADSTLLAQILANLPGDL